MTQSELQNIGFFVMMFSMLVAGSLFIAFGQITVRKLRRNPATRHHLGIDWVNGEDIAHVAQAFGMPRRLHARAERGALSCMVANSEVIRQHTTRLDRALGWMCYWSAMLCPVIVLGTGLIVNPR